MEQFHMSLIHFLDGAQTDILIVMTRYLIRQSCTLDLQHLTCVCDQVDCSRHPIGMTVFFRHDLPIKQSYALPAHCFRNFCAAFNEWPVSPTDKTETRVRG